MIKNGLGKQSSYCNFNRINNHVRQQRQIKKFSKKRKTNSNDDTKIDVPIKFFADCSKVFATGARFPKTLEKLQSISIFFSLHRPVRSILYRFTIADRDLPPHYEHHL